MVFEKADGYRGIWFTLGQFPSPNDKYSGGLGTYTAKHVPLAVYSAEANKTFFVYGGTVKAKHHLLAMVSYYDHERDLVPRPTIVHDKQGVDDPHDNPSIALDETGHIWVFVSGRGRNRPGFKYRSVEPLSVDEFELISEEEITYPQPWWIEGEGFLHLFTRYTGVRELYWNRSSDDGRTWAADRKLAGMEGHYQTSARDGNRVITAFNRHPGGTPDTRTDLYYVETSNLGETWTTVDGTIVETPMTDPACPARVHDFSSEGRLVYMKDIGFSKDGHPVILTVVSHDFKPGPDGDPRMWTLACWTGSEWKLREVTATTHNYDMGSLFIEGNRWRIIAPTEPGPQHWGAGGEMALWISDDEGRSWRKERDITTDSTLNHAYARRPVNAHADFHAFWADGNPDEPTESRLYFTNRDGTVVRTLPYDMDGETATPGYLDT